MYHSKSATLNDKTAASSPLRNRIKGSFSLCFGTESVLPRWSDAQNDIDEQRIRV